MQKRIVIFSDLDGCLLNKSDYSFAPATQTLARIRQLEIPLVLASSKTEVEMRRLADEMALADAPLICENGGVVFWSRRAAANLSANKTVLGQDREVILRVLGELKASFHFSSFEDMQIEGVCQATQLPPERAREALARSCTEPLQWEDSGDKIPFFRNALAEHSLTLTRGGRFWHVAGQTNKAAAMQLVMSRWEQELPGPIHSIAIGDSPIDQHMLDVADTPIAIPSPDGLVHVRIEGHNGTVANLAGAAGWADTVSQVLDDLL